MNLSIFTFALFAFLPIQIDVRALSFEKITSKDEVTVLVTDSGLGGLSVMARLAKDLEQGNYYQKVNLIFFNALFEEGLGYNSLQTREEKLVVFSRALTAAEKKYNPDIILVACNTLSVILPDTEFYQNTKTPVLGIVEKGVDLIKKELNEDSESDVIIFATATTVNENSHKELLISNNIDSDRIFTQACPELTDYIERDPSGFETELLISSFFEEALEKRDKEDSGPIHISLNCSHFGYSANLFLQYLKDNNLNAGSLINPNFGMYQELIPSSIKGRFINTEINAQVVSKTKISENRRNNIGAILEKDSKIVAESLINYRHTEDLF